METTTGGEADPAVCPMNIVQTAGGNLLANNWSCVTTWCLIGQKLTGFADVPQSGSQAPLAGWLDRACFDWLQWRKGF